MQEKCQVIILLLILATLISVHRDVASGGLFLPYDVMESPQGVQRHLGGWVNSGNESRL